VNSLNRRIPVGGRLCDKRQSDHYYWRLSRHRQSLRRRFAEEGGQVVIADIHGAAGEATAKGIIDSDTTWSLPAEAKFTDAQYKSYLAGIFTSTCTVLRIRR
jgi:hypothetical protein